MAVRSVVDNKDLEMVLDGTRSSIGQRSELPWADTGKFGAAADCMAERAALSTELPD